MNIFKLIFSIILFTYLSFFIQVQEILAEGSLLKTENIRKKLFDRMEDRKKKQPLREVAEKILEGTFSRVTDSESIWVRIENRSDFRKWTFKLSKKLKSAKTTGVRTRSPTFAKRGIVASSQTTATQAGIDILKKGGSAVDAALRAITIDAARLLRMEDQIGSITPGKSADFTVLESDPLSLPPATLADIPIWGTVFEGRLYPIQ